MPALYLVPEPAQAQFVQQGAKLVGNGAVGAANQGFSVALSGDGSTALLGGMSDNGGAGAAWVFTGHGGIWAQQGSKLVGSNSVGGSQGYSVALSGDGTTAIVGGPGDNNSVGAAWVFTLDAGVWTQQGSKLVASDAVGPYGPNLGTSVALSADGNTAIIGGPQDNQNTGAAWVFTRSDDVWTQQGAKLLGSGAVGNPLGMGFAVALSGDGNTAMIGADLDNKLTGAAWVFTRSGSVWTQQGAKLVGSGAGGAAGQGWSVALSGDGSTALIGGIYDTDGGAAWVFTRQGGVWTQQGSKLVGSGAVGSAGQGWSVALSGDGSTALIGGPVDHGQIGATWVFTRNGGVWTQQGSKLVGSGASGNPEQGRSVALSANGNMAIVGGENDNNNAGAAWVFARGCQVSDVQVISQTASLPGGGIWGGLLYDHLMGTTIAGRGCALTSLNMALNFVGESWNPGTLNSLLDSAPGGYTPSPAGSVNWLPATAASNVGNTGGPVVFSSLGGWVNSDGPDGSSANLSQAIATVEKGICATPAYPVIVAVRSQHANSSGVYRYPGHFVLVTGETINPDGSKALIINDPADLTAIIGRDSSTGTTGYTNPATGMAEFWTRGTVHDPADLTGLSVSVDAVVNLLITDPNGLQSGYLNGNPTPVQNIPNSGAGVDEIDDDVTGDVGSPVQSVTINSPATGVFQFSLTGTAAGPYSLEVNAEASDGSIQSFSFSGLTIAGTTAMYQMVYTPTPGTVSQPMLLSLCDLVHNGSITAADVQLVVNEALGSTAAVNDLNGDGIVNVVDVQIEMNAALGAGCAAQ